MRRPHAASWIPSCIVSGLVVGLVTALPGTAAARTSPLEGQPAVRHKFELRDSRLEITPTFELSLMAPWRNTFSIGAKISYHLTDSLSVEGLFFYGFSANAGVFDQVITSLPTTPLPAPDQTPTQDQATTHANSIPFHGGIGLTFTPWFGKLALFSKSFLAYDIYVTGGFGFAQTKNDFPGDDRSTICDTMCGGTPGETPDFGDPRNDGPHNAGFNPGIQFGAGLHIFFSEFAALDIYVRDYMFTDNPSGFDFNQDLKVDDADRRFLSHLFFGVGLAFFLPPKAKISK